jgi:hypothetical protein
MVPTICTVHFVVGAHHCPGARIDALLEMRQVELTKRLFVDLYVDRKAGIFHAVTGVVLGSRNNVVMLNAARECGTRFA